uniref:Uncharacterized protein n=1 Tax=Chenopodium quinoa TaxID=63459 RepID=A0A803MZ78_CHEQI
MQSGCDYFKWFDTDMVDWQKDVINVLLAEKHKMATDHNLLKARVTSLEKENRRLTQQMPGKPTANRVVHGVISNDQLCILVALCAIVSVLASAIVVKLFG